MDEKVQPDLQEAVAALYRTFAAYPFHHPVKGCLCCVSRADQALLASQPLQHLSGSDLGRYTYKALTTWGEVDDFKHFLPRILELLNVPQERMALPDLFILFGKLSYAHWDTWPEQERQAILNYLLALWRCLLVSDPGAENNPLPAVEFLDGLLDGQIDIMPLLSDWYTIDTPASLSQLADFISTHCEGRAFSDKQRFRDWLCDARIREMLEAGFFASRDETAATALSQAVSILEWYASSPEPPA